MPLHVHLDFTTPFTVGDTICTAYPPGEHLHAGGPASYECMQGKILSIKLVLELNQENSWLIKEPLAEKELTVKSVVYTVAPLPQFHLSPFIVECKTEEGSHPILFSSEDELRTYGNRQSLES